MDIISWQNKTRTDQTQSEKDKLEYEKKVLNEIWKVEEDKEKEKAKKKLKKYNYLNYERF